MKTAKTILFFCLLLLLLTVSAENVIAAFGVTDFEKNILSGWRLNAGRQKEFVSGRICTDQTSVGTTYYKLNLQKSLSGYVALSKTVKLPPKTPVPGAIKLAFRGTAPAPLIVRGLTRRKKWLVHSFTLPSSPTWQTYEYTFDWQEEITQVAVELRAKKQGTFCFDDIRLLAKQEKSGAILLLLLQEKTGKPEQIAPKTAISCLPGPRLKKAIEDLGLQFCTAAYSPEITAAYLRKFNLIIIGTEGESAQKTFSVSGLKRLQGLLKDYVSDGGGLFVTRSPGWGYGRDIDRSNVLLEPFDAKILNEQVTDDANSFVNLENVRFFWTGAIQKDHPVTQGVNGIFYPDYFNRKNRSSAGFSDFTSPVRTNADWTVLIRAMKTAQTMELEKAAVPPPPIPGSYKESAPLLALRQYGRGRAAVFPVATTIFWHDAEHIFWNRGATADGKINGKPGNSFKLMNNLIKWLTEPSKGTFGGWKNQQKAALPDVGFRKIDWDKMVLKNKLLPQNYKGLIGAQSSLSIGKSSPEQMIKAAQSAGYNFIAFTEDLSAMTPEKFKILKNICAKACNKTFQAYPGFSYRDESGNLWSVFSDKLFWPKKSWFSKKYPGRLIENNASTRAWGWPPVIWTENSRNPEKSHLQGNFNTYAAITLRSGKITDDSRKDMERLLRSSYVFSPVVVHFVQSDKEVQQAWNSKWQTCIRWVDNHVIEGVTGVGFGASLRGNPLYIRPSYVTEGPVIEDFRVLNFGISDLSIPGNDFWRMRIEVSSSAGLKEVRVLDADRGIFRRFLPNGKKHFQTLVDGWHDRQRVFLIEAIDRLNRKAVSWRIPTIVQENNFLRCSDNFNTMPQGKWMGAPQNMQNIRGYENYLARRGFQRSGTPHIGNTGYDGKRPAVEYINALSSRFGTFFDYRYRENYPDGTTGNDDLTDRRECAVANEYFNARVIYKMFTCRQNGPLLYLVEGEVDILKDFSTPDFRIFSLEGRGKAFNASWINASGKVTRQNLSVRALSGKLAVNDGIGIWPCFFQGSIGFIALSEGISFEARKSGKFGYLNGFYRKDKKQYRQGEKIRYSYVTVISQLDPPENDSFLIDIHKSFGFNGKNTLFNILPKKGEVLKTGLVFKLKAVDNVFTGKVRQAKLPLHQPIELTGVNPRWDAGILYKGNCTLLMPIKKSNTYKQRYFEQLPKNYTNELHRIPVDENGKAMFQIDSNFGGHRVFIGNLLTADNPDLWLTLVDHRSGKAAFDVHNPTDKTISAVIRPGHGLEILGSFTQKVTVAPGTTLRVKIK